MSDLSKSRWTIVLLLVLLYGVGLAQGLHYPWVGLHDFNGAFYSQLARNILRYPFEIHHGMPIVAVGAAVPPPDERSIYGTHPPGLVWMLAAMFRACGSDAEWAARLVPVLGSLTSMGLLVWLLGRAAGWNTAIVAGVIYAFLPMSVFFGRMVDQEAVTLPLMLAALALERMSEDAGDRRRGVRPVVGLYVVLAALIWTDWAGVLFAGLFCMYRLWKCRRSGAGLRGAVLMSSACVVAAAALVLYIVYAGLGGSWEALASVFLSRRKAVHVASLAQAYRWSIENLTGPGLILAALGTLVQLGGFLVVRRRARAAPGETSAHASSELRGPFMGLGLVTLTGVIWLALFWRQFMIHQYWMFYLGPWVAAASASLLLRVGGVFERAARALGPTVVAIGSVVLVVAGLRGIGDFFERVSCPRGYIQMCRAVNQMTKPDERVVLADSPVRLDPYASESYVLRSIVPPLAYYMDRSFDVPASPAELGLRRPDKVVVVEAARAGESQAALRAVFEGSDVRQVGDHLVVDCRARRGP